MSLDSNGHLASLIRNESWINLKSCIQSSLSPMAWFNLTVFDENMIRVNDIPITSGSAVNEKNAALYEARANPAFSAYKLGVTHTVISALANISNGGSTNVLAEDLNQF